MADDIWKNLIGPVVKLFEPLAKELAEANRTNIQETFGPVTFRVKKPDNVGAVIEQLKRKLGDKGNIAGDDKTGEFHLGFTQGRYVIKGEDVFITIVDKWIFDTYPEISCEIRDIIDEATRKAR